MRDLVPLITGGSGALVVLLLLVYAFFLGKIHSDPEFRKLEAERDYWKAASEAKDKALEIERRTVNETVLAGTVTNQLIGAVVSMASERRKLPSPRKREPPQMP